MSRTTASIMRINQELDKISGLDGIVADYMENLENSVKSMVSNIIDNHSDASIFNYYGNDKNELENLLDIIDKSPLLDEVLQNGETVTMDIFEPDASGTAAIVRHLGNLYYIVHTNGQCTTFTRL